MSITIILEDIRVIDWSVDMTAERIDVSFQYLDASGESWKSANAIFWREIPEVVGDDGFPTDPPDSWFLIPASYLTELNNLNTAIDTALTNRFLEP